MIKIDKIEILQTKKKATIWIGLIACLFTVYTAFFALLAWAWKKMRRNSTILTITYACIILIGNIYMISVHYTLDSFIRPYLYYNDNLFLLDPMRIIIAAAYGLWYIFNGHLLAEGVDDWVIAEKKQMLDDLIPPGKFSYDNREHMLLFGTTGSGKGITLNHILKDQFRRLNTVIMVSAKLASTDPYNQLDYCRHLADKYNRKLYVVSMDPSVEDKCSYNPFKHINKVEMQNALASMIQSDSHFYKTNFVAWVLTIFKLIKECGEEVTLQKILDLYEYKDYEAYIKTKVSKKALRNPEKYLSAKIRKYSKNAENDSANLDLICEAGEEVFSNTCEESISIFEAVKENAIIYFDLNGVSAKAATALIGACITAELQHAAMKCNDPTLQKTIICDEASFYISEMFVSCFALARSAGYKIIVSTQGPSDLKGPQNDEKILSQLINNSNQFGILRINDSRDAEEAGELIGTIMRTENTRRADGSDYEGTGSIKAVPVLAANPNKIKNLAKREMIYYEKNENSKFEPTPMMVRWRVDDL